MLSIDNFSIFDFAKLQHYSMKSIQDTELIITKDIKIYHLNIDKYRRENILCFQQGMLSIFMFPLLEN